MDERSASDQAPPRGDEDRRGAHAGFDRATAAGAPAPPGVDPREARELERLRRLAYLLDDAFRIPVIGHRFGIDALMGLVPGIGDVGGFALSAYLITRARALGAPPALLARMAGWSTLDLAVGAVPIVGDVADFVIKPNRRSLRMLERYLAERSTQHDGSGHDASGRRR